MYQNHQCVSIVIGERMAKATTQIGNPEKKSLNDPLPSELEQCLRCHQEHKNRNMASIARHQE
jgi:cytochrome c553